MLASPSYDMRTEECFDEAWEDHLTGLAATFDAVPHPVWFHDLDHRCVYRNPPAFLTDVPSSATPHDVLDHQGNILGRLTF